MPGADRCHIEFAVADPARFDRLRRFFDALRADKDEDTWRGNEEWLGFLDDGARAWFWWPTPAELDALSRSSDAATPSDRVARPGPAPRWDFASMVEAIERGSYRLVECARVAGEPGLARLVYAPAARPYGGSGALRALIECFGGTVGAVID